MRFTPDSSQVSDKSCEVSCVSNVLRRQVLFTSRFCSASKLSPVQKKNGGSLQICIEAVSEATKATHTTLLHLWQSAISLVKEGTIQKSNQPVWSNLDCLPRRNFVGILRFLLRSCLERHRCHFSGRKASSHWRKSERKCSCSRCYYLCHCLCCSQSIRSCTNKHHTWYSSLHCSISSSSRNFKREINEVQLKLKHHIEILKS